MNLYLRLVFSFAIFISGEVFSEVSNYESLCSRDERVQLARSEELKEMVGADQNERENFENMSEEEKFNLSKNDLKRRKRVGEIFGEGCFKTPEDYLSASLIYQHGDVLDHYFQAFVWANRALQLGDDTAKYLLALTIDRYLVSVGKKQLFGSQAYWSSDLGECFCLQQTESTFPDAKRKDYSGITLSERYEWLATLNEGKDCSIAECPINLEPTLIGSIPGFW